MNDKINAYLSALRDSGRINMFGAIPYLQDQFGLTRAEAKAALLQWMESFKQEREQMNQMTVSVYFEAKSGAHMVAQFDNEETYMACLSALESLAESKGYIVTESVNYEGESK